MAPASQSHTDGEDDMAQEEVEWLRFREITSRCFNYSPFNGNVCKEGRSLATSSSFVPDANKAGKKNGIITYSKDLSAESRLNLSSYFIYYYLCQSYKTCKAWNMSLSQINRFGTCPLSASFSCFGQMKKVRQWSCPTRSTSFKANDK